MKSVYNKLKLLLVTISYLKPIQVYFQLWYRVKNPFIPLIKYNKYNSNSIGFLTVFFFPDLVLSDGKYKDDNTFTFLGIKHSFGNNLDWNFSEQGKLWNYNLQYFDYLMDESIQLEKRIFLLSDFSNELLAGNIKLEPYPVSLRIVNSILFVSKHQLRNEFIERALKYQISYLEENLEYHLLGNHLIENIFALFIASYSLNNSKLNEKVHKLLLKQLKEQTLSDGAHFECSPMYHSIILSKLLLCIEVVQENNNFSIDISQLKLYASRMIGWINQFSFPDGSWALMNDASLGVAPNTLQLNNACDSLSIDTFLQEMNQSGFRKLKGKNWECIVDVGNIQPTYQPAHAHADMLSFCLWYKGKQIIVDPGISTYNNTARRHLERGTHSHNTASINGQNQSQVWSSFRIGKRATCKVLKQTNDEIIGSHNGFCNGKVIHTRKYTNSNNSLVILDEMKHVSDKSMSFEINTLFSSEFHASFGKGKVYSDEVTILYTGEGDLVNSFYATNFNQLIATQSLVIKNNAEVKMIFSFS